VRAFNERVLDSAYRHLKSNGSELLIVGDRGAMVAVDRARAARPLSRKRARHRALDVGRVPQALGGGFGFWLLRELGWWWSVTFMLALVADFLRESPVLQGASAWLGRQPVRSR
jgi:hypothetical protein